MTVIPLFLSALTGMLWITALIQRKGNWTATLFLGPGLGLGFSAFLAFLSLILFDKIHQPFLLGMHIILIAAGAGLIWRQAATAPLKLPPRTKTLRNLCSIGLLLLAMVPVWKYGQFYPFGGWDAWQVWNLKARVLMAGAPYWQNIFNPSLWETSPHYPLLLPLINCWHWTLLEQPDTFGPFLTGMVFTFLVCGLLWSAGKDSLGPAKAMLMPLLFATGPFLVILSTSQYCDLLIAYYFLAAVMCLVLAQRHQSLGWMVIAGFMLGILSFTKPEGTILAGLICMLASIPLLRQQQPMAKKTNQFFCLLAAFFYAGLPSIIFYTLYSPGNQTFVNGLTSTDQPATLMRIKMILAFLAVECISEKWNGIWILLFCGIVLFNRRLFQGTLLVIPLVLFVYLGTIVFYYFTNTYFEIGWWLQASLHRILYSLLPVLMFWISQGLRDRPSGGIKR